MKDEVIGVMHEIIAHDPSYSCMLGNDGCDVRKQVSLNWIMPRTGDIRESVRVLLDHLLADVLASYSGVCTDDFPPEPDATFYVNAQIDPGVRNCVFNPFIDRNYAVTKNARLADLENYIRLIEVSDNVGQIFIKMRFPIYEVPSGSVTTFGIDVPTV